MSHVYTTAKILEVRDENYRVKTFVLNAAAGGALPGQFAMVWLPGVDEKPMCIVNDEPAEFSVAAVGPFSRALHGLHEGDVVSFRGPLGKGFSVAAECKRILLVGGGYGVAALNFLAKKAVAGGVGVTMVIGARTEKDVIFEREFRRKGAEVFAATDDGSAGFTGRAHELVNHLLSQGRKFDCFYSCGPERMMLQVARIAEREGKPSQLSLERYMGCGIGICGKCDAGGAIVCRQGPVMTGSQALALSEFGKCQRDTMGHLHVL